MSNVALVNLLQATGETLYMVFMSSFIGIFFGLWLGCFLFITKKNQGHNAGYQILSFIVNATRSLPFIILLISIIPLTRLLIGTTIGTNAAIVPLAIAAVAFFARIVENALNELPMGLREAAASMGASNWQLFYKIYLPESLPQLVRGATLTVISLIGYSAMAGVVGGGGLGELAINYGYQQFDTWIMLETVLILIVLVQVVQSMGDQLAHAKKIKPVLLSVLLVFAVCIGAQFFSFAGSTANTIRVGVMSGLPEQVMQAAQVEAKKTYNLNIQIVTFSDYVQPNLALNNGSIDANIFQHEPYLLTQKAAYKLDITPIGKTFVYPMGFYSHKISHIKQLKSGDLIAIPNDPSNQTRALLMLQKAGLIKLNGNQQLYTLKDIGANPLQLKFIVVDAAQLPRTLDDAVLVAINNDFLGPVGLTVSQAVLKEGPDSPYANLIVVRTADVNNPALKNLVAVMHSPAVVTETEKVFPNGAAIPAF